MHAQPCPSLEELASYVEMGTEFSRHHEIEQHLLECPTCRAWVDEARESEKAVAELKSFSGAWLAGPSSHENQIDASTRSSVFASPVVLPHFIDNYDLREEIGRGGMGVVYRAIQKATKREVALKVLLEGPFASKSARQRFEREVELAAQLDHPGIVTVHESGVESGRYYFAMQHIRGMRLDQWVEENTLTVREVLELFVKIGDAITHAHQRGVIHRDLKPSNILIDDSGNPHILDFGLAKVADSDSQENSQPSLLSMTGQVVGTLPYLSPEQASDERHPADIRTDVYSLGVILYQALTGQYPYQVTGNMVDVLKSIINSTPEVPSSVTRGLNEEIDTVLLKSLSKEPERRYQSVSEMTQDISRYLNGEPLEARKDSKWYLIRKNLSRYKVSVGILSLIILSLVIVAFVFANLYQNSIEAQKEAEDSRDIAHMGLKLTAIEKTDIHANIQNLSILKEFLLNNPDNRNLHEIQARIIEEEITLLAGIEDILNSNQTDPLIDCFQDSKAVTVLRSLGQHYPASRIQDRVVEQLESVLHVPFLKDRGQLTLDAISVVQSISPENVRAKWATNRIQKISSGGKVAHEEDFSSLDNSLHDKWTNVWGKGTIEVIGEQEWLSITGDEQDLAAAKLSLAEFTNIESGNYNTLAIDFDIRFPKGVISDQDPTLATIRVGSGNIPMPALVFHSDRIRLKNSVTRVNVDYPLQLQEERVYHLELRFSQDIQICDVLLDGIYLFEDLPYWEEILRGDLEISASYNNTIMLDNLCIRRIPEKAKVNTVTVPRIINNALSLTPLASWSLAQARNIEILNLDKGDVEIATIQRIVADTDRREKDRPTPLVIYRVNPNNLSLKELSTIVIPELKHPLDLTIEENRFFVFDFPAVTGQDEQRGMSRLHIFSLDSDYSLMTHTSIERSHVANAVATHLRLNEGMEVLCVGYGYNNRGLLTYVSQESGEYEQYAESKVQFEDSQNNYYSLLPRDMDGDGDDDLLAGMGAWDGDCPALITMEKGKCESVRALYPPSGATYLAIFNFGSKTEYLVAISKIPEKNYENERIPTGIRIWPLRQILEKEYPEPIFFEQHQGICGAIVSGKVGGESIVVIASINDNTKDSRFAEVRIHAYALEDSKIQKAWECVIPEHNASGVSLNIADLNGDGGNELLVSMTGTGKTLIFTGIR